MGKRKPRDDEMLPEYDFSKGVRGKFAERFADKRWWVTLDPDLVDLLSGSGSPADHLRGFAARRKSKREHLVVTVVMSESEYEAVRPVLRRIGAEARWMPPHPALAAPAGERSPRTRRAGSPRARVRKP